VPQLFCLIVLLYINVTGSCKCVLVIVFITCGLQALSVNDAASRHGVFMYLLCGYVFVGVALHLLLHNKSPGPEHR